MAPHSSTLAWKIPWMEELGRLQSMGSRRVRHDWMTSLSLFTFMHWRRKWQSTPVFLPGESQGWGSLLGCLLSMGLHRVGHDWSNLAVAAAAYISYIYGIYKMCSELLIHISMKDKFTNKTIVFVYNLFCLELIATGWNTVIRLFRSVFLTPSVKLCNIFVMWWHFFGFNLQSILKSLDLLVVFSLSYLICTQESSVFVMCNSVCLDICIIMHLIP